MTVHAYVHYFARIWFWTNLSRSASSHPSLVDFKRCQYLSLCD